MLHDTDDAVGNAADSHTLAEWRAVDEQPFGHGIAEYGDRSARAILFARERPAHRDAQILDVEVPLARGGQLDVARFLIAVRHRDLIARLPGGHHGDGRSEEHTSELQSPVH